MTFTYKHFNNLNLLSQDRKSPRKRKPHQNLLTKLKVAVIVLPPYWKGQGKVSPKLDRCQDIFVCKESQEIEE